MSDQDRTVESPTGDAAATPGGGRLAIGTRLGRHVVTGHVGEGGMGIVYLAHDAELGRRVAIKLLRPERQGLSHELRLVREAQALAQLAHPNVVALHDVASCEHGVYLAMEYVDGRTLDHVLASRPHRWREVLALFLQAGRGLAAMHALGLMHRDVKPSNLIVDGGGRVRVGDFGLARLADGADEPGMSGVADDPVATTRLLDAAITEHGAVVGTPRYMAPEQRAGRPSRQSDQFSFCAALWEGLHGKAAIEGTGGRADTTLSRGDSLSATAGRGRGTAIDARVHLPSRGAVPGWLRRILLRGLASDPAARWPSMAALLEAIDARPRRQRRRLILGAALFALVAVAGAFLLGRAQPESDPCDGGAEMLARTWAPSARAAALERIGRLGSRGAALAPTLDRQLVDHARRWSAGHRDACQAARRRSLSDTLVDRRMACLQANQAALAAVAQIVDGATEPDLPGVERAVAALPDPVTCADLSALSLYGDSPPSPAIAPAVQAVRNELAQASIQFDAGRLLEARTLAGQAVAEARAAGYKPALARALYSLGIATQKAGNNPASLPILEETVDVALEAGLDGVAVTAWAHRAWTEGSQNAATDYAVVMRGFDMIERIASRSTVKAGDRAQLYHDVSAIQLTHGDRAAGRQSIERAVAEARAALASSGRAVDARVLATLTSAYVLLLDDESQQKAMTTEAIDRLAHAVGDDHYEVLILRLSRNNLLAGIDRAATELAQVCERFDRVHPWQAKAILSCWSELGFLREQRGDRSGAIAAMRRAVEVADANGFTASGKEDIEESAGYLALWRGDFAAATAQFAVAAKLPRQPKEHFWRRFTRARLELGLAQVKRATDDPAGAIALLDGVIADLEVMASERHEGRARRRLGRAHAERTAALVELHAPAAKIAAAARAAADLLRTEGGRADEIAALDRLARARLPDR